MINTFLDLSVTRYVTPVVVAGLTGLGQLVILLAAIPANPNVLDETTLVPLGIAVAAVAATAVGTWAVCTLLFKIRADIKAKKFRDHQLALTMAQLADAIRKSDKLSEDQREKVSELLARTQKLSLQDLSDEPSPE